MNRFTLAAAATLALSATAAIACGPPKATRIGVWQDVPPAYRPGGVQMASVQPALNAMPPAREGCTPIRQQVAGDAALPPPMSRLDQQPPARTLLAVDREVGGCHEVTLVGGRRQGKTF